jgi:Icc-related predicted phosphoesterase
MRDSEPESATPITVLAIADEFHPALYDHFQPERWKDVDLVLSAGDVSPDYLDVLATRIDVPVFYVRGNHDGKYARSRYYGFENAHRRILEFRGLRIAGFEGSMRYNDGTCQLTEHQMSRLVWWTELKALRNGKPDIILAHAPPAGFHDGEDRCHKGFACFRRAIHAWRPAFFVHGHTHRYYGRELVGRLEDTSVINAVGFHRFQALPGRADDPATFIARSTG